MVVEPLWNLFLIIGEKLFNVLCVCCISRAVGEESLHGSEKSTNSMMEVESLCIYKELSIGALADLYLRVRNRLRKFKEAINEG